MRKFYGPIGFISTVETKPGVWVEKSIERPYYGDITKKRLNFSQSGSVNTDVTLTTFISVIADPYVNEYFDNIRYVLWLGKKWKIVNVEPEYPRIVLQLGGIYNG